MSVTQINNTLASALGESTRKKNELDKDAFLQLLVAQLSHQDPTNASDPNAMIEQMTSFSSVEQLTNMNKGLEILQGQNDNLFRAQTVSLVGKSIRVSGSGFELKNGKAAMTLELEKDADVKITIKDKDGKVVATLDQGGKTAGSHKIEWDGSGSWGSQLADGSYTVSVEALDSEGQPVNNQTSFFLTVDSIGFANGSVQLRSGSQVFTLADILEIAS